MANRILKGLAVAAGTGLALGFTSGRTRLIAVRPRRVPVFVPDPPPAEPQMEPARPSNLANFPNEEHDEFLNIEPLLDRLERLEARVETLGPVVPESPASPPVEPFDFATAVADLERRVEENTRDLTSLREHVTEAERRMTAAAAFTTLSLEKTRAELPALIEQKVSAAVEDLRSRFSAEIEQSRQRTLEMFERTLDEKISSRISSIEKVLAEQAGSIDALTTRSAETDKNLQRLVSAIEKLCERVQFMDPAHAQPSHNQPTQRPFENRMPFEAQLHDAMQSEPVVQVLRNGEQILRNGEPPAVPAPAFTGSETRPVKKSRFLFRNLLVAGFSLLASRWLS